MTVRLSFERVTTHWKSTLGGVLVTFVVFSIGFWLEALRGQMLSGARISFDNPYERWAVVGNKESGRALSMPEVVDTGKVTGRGALKVRADLDGRPEGRKVGQDRGEIVWSVLAYTPKGYGKPPHFLDLRGATVTSTVLVDDGNLMGEMPDKPAYFQLFFGDCTGSPLYYCGEDDKNPESHKVTDISSPTARYSVWCDLDRRPSFSRLCKVGLKMALHDQDELTSVSGTIYLDDVDWGTGPSWFVRNFRWLLGVIVAGVLALAWWWRNARSPRASGASKAAMQGAHSV